MKISTFFKALSLFIMLIPFASNAQMIEGTDTLYGNEWIDYQQNYYKIKIGQDGIHRLDFQTMNNTGVFSNTSIPQGSDFQLFHLGKEIPIYISNSGVLTTGDFIEFYGKKNRGEVDKYIYEQPDYQLNPAYSLFSDTAIYFLTWSSGTHSRLIDQSNNLTNPPQKEDFCINTVSIEYHNRHSTGQSYGSSSDVSAKYDLGEGYCKSTFSANQSFTLNTPNPYSTGNDAEINARVLVKGGSHKISLDWNSNNYILDSFNNWAVKQYSFTTPSTAINASNTLQINGLANADDKFYVATIDVKYSQTFDFDNKDYYEFELPTNNQDQYLEITNFNHSGQAPILYDFTNNQRIVTNLNGNTVEVVLPSSLVSRELILIANSNQIVISDIDAYDFVDYGLNVVEYILLSHNALFDDGSGNNYVQEYANYRASIQGGGYTTKVVDVLQVYHQFGYGITRHEQAIRNFTNWAVKNWQSEYLFLVGKGVYYRNIRNNNSDWLDVDFVPSFGFPSSDNLFGTDNSSNIPKLAIGRIGAYTPDMIRQYLDKIKEMENVVQTAPQTIEDKAWMKNVLHLGGGDPNIQNFIKNRLEEIGDTISQGIYGANVFGLYKHSTDVIQTATTDDVVNFINQGTGLITFFGHSAPNTLDFDIGEPTQYQNQGKYPMIYAMGCNTNRLFESRTTLSEKYVFVEDRGAIGFIGSTATTSLSNLNLYGKIFYQKLANEMYGATIGSVMQSVVEDYPLSGFWGELVQNNIMLHGDPAVRIYPQEGTDFLVNETKTVINPSFVNVQSDSFQLELVITNLGQTTIDSLDILIEQQYPNGDIVAIKTLKVPSPSFEKNITTWIPLDNKEILGENKLIITLDNNNKIVELPVNSESNNIAEFLFQVISNNAFPVYPKEFAIVPNQNITLKASTANAFSDNVNYYIEIDTAYSFDSPIKQQEVIASSGGLIQWSPSINLLDSTVYFWRVSLDSIYTNGNGFDWQESSFNYIDGSSDGWSQFHEIQKSRISTNTLSIEEEIELFTFLEKEIKVTNVNFTGYSLADVAIYQDGFKLFNYYPCPNGLSRQTFWVTIFDANTLELTSTTPGPHNCFGTEVLIAELDSIDGQQRIINYLNNEPKVGDYVVVFITQSGSGNMYSNDWALDSLSLGTNIYQVLEAHGASQIRQMLSFESPYTFIYKHGDPLWIGMKEDKSTGLNDYMETITTITGRQKSGYLTSLPIGPSSNWQSLHWNMTEIESHDQANIDIIGVTQSGEDSVLVTGIQAYDTTLANIDAAVFPYLKLKLNLQDTVNRTAPQLDFWRVLYDPVPELALTPDQKYTFHADTIQQGDELFFEVAAENISEQNMDSVLVKYSITNEFNQEQIFYRRLKPVEGGDTLVSQFTMDTRSLQNKNLLKVEMNPDEDQPEEFHFNNIGVKEFYVETDKRNPLLDVTFDGAHIMNGDIVSARPEIVIALNDDNQYLALEDTSLFRLFVRYPSGVTKRFYMDGQEMTFYPAADVSLEEKNEATIEWRPHFMEDGEYQLQVQARDASENESGTTDYTVDFEVFNESRITNVLNYPNPFSTSTQFVFTLTGDRVPDNMRIQIMTVAGQVVREITMDELGPIRVGHNRTEFAWDGTDQFGDRLANGVYIYHVIATKDGEELEIMNNGTFDYFKSNLGKMVILR